MKHIKEYFNSEEVNPINGYINESFLLMALCGAVALHFTVKGMKAIRKHASNFWGWALGEKNLSTTAAESLDNRQNIIKRIYGTPNNKSISKYIASFSNGHIVFAKMYTICIYLSC